MTSTAADALGCAADAGPVPVSDAETAVAGLLSVVADPMRWRIVSLLAGAELCTTHLQDLLGATQNLVSHHLKVLREAGVVQTAPCGRFTYYRLRPGALDGLSEAVAKLASASSGSVARRPC
jgi:ArsR family transcriptional regulator, arsenate/arsenite/antimonite-responsive transcriptional repressor